jgi:ABC-type transport system substrate-binding protein
VLSFAINDNKKNPGNRTYTREAFVHRHSAATVLASAILALCMSAAIEPAVAQKQGGTLRFYHRDNPPGPSLIEESTVSSVHPFANIYNNLVMFDRTKPTNNLETIVPDLAKSWEWDASYRKLTFKLNEGVKWHDGKPFTAKDVQCTWHLIIGKTENDDFRKNPRKSWWFNLDEVTLNGDHEVTFNLKEPQPAFVMMLAAGWSVVYPCHVAPREMRAKPVGTGPFKFDQFRRNEMIRLVRNPDYFKKGKPYLDAIEVRIIENRSTRILAFTAGEFDMTYRADVTVPLLGDVKSQAPKAVCDLAPTSVASNLIVNRLSPPFDNPDIRKAMALALNRNDFVSILSHGKASVGGAMLPSPEGVWGMPPEFLATLSGYGADLEKNAAEARKIMERLGYSAAKPLKVKVATRNIAEFRDPAVILLDQLKRIYVEGELDVIETAQWYNRVVKRDYQVGLNLTGSSVDDPDVTLVENYSCKSERNYTQYCNADVESAIAQQSRQTDITKRKQMVWDVEKALVDDVARPIIAHGYAATCWHPYVKNMSIHHNSIYNDARHEDVWLDK